MPSITLYPAHDVYTDQGNPTTNYSASEYLVTGLPAGVTKYGWLKFDLTSIPSGRLITSATLYLRRYFESNADYDGEPDGWNYAIYDSSDTAWTEGALTWNTQPTLGSAIATFVATWNTYDQTHVITDILGSAQTAHSGSGLVTWVIVPQTNNSQQWFSSSEHSQSPLYPRLVLEYTDDSVGNITIPPGTYFLPDLADYIEPKMRQFGTGYERLGWGLYVRPNNNRFDFDEVIAGVPQRRIVTVPVGEYTLSTLCDALIAAVRPVATGSHWFSHDIVARRVLWTSSIETRIPAQTDAAGSGWATLGLPGIAGLISVAADQIPATWGFRTQDRYWRRWWFQARHADPAAPSLLLANAQSVGPTLGYTAAVHANTLWDPAQSTGSGEAEAQADTCGVGEALYAIDETNDDLGLTDADDDFYVITTNTLTSAWQRTATHLTRWCDGIETLLPQHPLVLSQTSYGCTIFSDGGDTVYVAISGTFGDAITIGKIPYGDIALPVAGGIVPETASMWTKTLLASGMRTKTMSACKASDGNYIVAWHETSATSVYAMKFTPSGTYLWNSGTKLLVASGIATTNCTKVVADTSGGAIILWNTGSTTTTSAHVSSVGVSTVSASSYTTANNALGYQALPNGSGGAWTVTKERISGYNDLLSPRSCAGYAVLPGGRGMICGGQPADTPLKEYVLDSATGSVTAITPAPSVQRVGVRCVAMNDGNVLIISGFHDFSPQSYNTTCDIFNGITFDRTSTGSVALGRAEHCAVLLGDGRVMAIGGYITSDPYGSPEWNTLVPTTNTAELYNSGSWSSAASMSQPRARFTSTVLDDGRVLVAGGISTSDAILSSTEIYDPSNDTWQSGPTMSTSRVDHTATKLLDGTILITGGRDGSLTSLSSAELFDPSDDSLSSAGTMTHARNRHTAELLPDGTVIVAGAGYGSADTNTSELYDSGTWTAKGNLLDGRTGAICMTISGVAVFLAGIPSNTPVMSYDSATGQWSGLATAVVVRNIASSGATVFSVPFPTLSDSIAAPRLCQGPNKDVYVYCANSTGTSVFVGRVTAAGTTPWSGGGVTISSLLAPSISIDGMVRCCKTAAGIAVVYTKDKGTGVAAIYYRHLSEVDGSAIVTETQVCASPTSTVRDWVHTVSYKRGSTLILGERATHPSTLPIQQTITKVLDNGTIVYSNTADGLDRSSPIDDLWPSFHPNEFRANGRMPAITVHPTYYVGFTASSNFALRLYKLPATGVYQGVNATSAWSSELAAANQTTTNAYSTILAHPDGTGIYVVWHERKTGSPFADRVYCAKYLWDGTQSWKTYVSNSGFEANTNGPAKAVLTSSGKVAIAWDSNGSGSLRLYAQMVDTDGSVLFTAGGLQVSAGTVVTAFELQAGIADDMILVWPISTTAFDAQRVDSSGTKLWNSGSPLHPLTGLSSALVRTSARDVSGGMWFGYQTSSRAWGIKLSQTGVVSGPMRILPDATAWAAVVPFMFPSTNGDVFVVGRGVSPELNSQLINRITASGTYPWGSVAGIRFEPGYQTDPHRQIDSSGNGMTAGYDHAKLNAGASEGALWMYHTDFTTGVIDRPTAADYGGLYQINFNTTETANNSNFFYVGHLDPSGYNVFMCRERPNTTTGNNWYMALMYMKNGVVKNYIRQLHGHPIQTTAISTGSFDSGEGVELRGLGGLQYGTFTLPEIIDQINSVSAAFDLVFGYGMSTYGLDTTFKIQFGATVYSRTLPVYHEASPTDTASLLQYAFNHASAPAEMPPSPVTVQWDETTGKFKVISSANFTLIGSGETRGGAWTMLGFEPFANTVATLTGPLEISTTGRGERRRHQCWVAALGTTYVLPVANGSVATQNLMALLGFGPGDLTLGDALAPTPKFPV